MQDDTAHLLVVEDDDELAALLLEYLSQHGFELSRVATGTEAVNAIARDRPDLVILDLMLPGQNGLDVCREVRATYQGAIVMLTASQSATDHVAGLELGADDFVNKPIEPRVLVARVRSQLRRRRGGGVPRPAVDRLRVGTLEIDVPARDARVAGEVIPLTNMEFDVLTMLARDAGAVVKRDDLYTEVMGTEYDGIDRGMDVHVSRIRRKLAVGGFDTSRLKSVRGVGYLLASR
ncbi:MAG: response regulator transcription factor [Myxococcota bacterium]